MVMISKGEIGSKYSGVDPKRCWLIYITSSIKGAIEKVFKDTLTKMVVRRLHMKLQFEEINFIGICDLTNSPNILETCLDP